MLETKEEIRDQRPTQQTPTEEAPSASASSAPADSASAVSEEHNRADVRFVKMMIPHHQQALQMAKIVLPKSGLDAHVRQMAEKIQREQGPQIKTIDRAPPRRCVHGSARDPQRHEPAGTEARALDRRIPTEPDPHNAVDARPPVAPTNTRVDRSTCSAPKRNTERHPSGVPKDHPKKVPMHGYPQISATTKALQSVALELMDAHLNHCVTEARADGGNIADD